MGTYLRPATLDGALAALAAAPRMLLAGGTDHFPARAIRTPDEHILDLTAIPGQRAIARRGEDWFIPFLATWTDVIEARLPPLFDGLAAAARRIGGVQIQNSGTIVGNVCNASPAADGIPCLLALDAAVELASRSGRRTLRLADFVRGPRLTARRPDEIVTGLLVPALPRPAHAGRVIASFDKLGGRRYLVISIAMIATVAAIAPDGTLDDIRIAVGACSATAIRLTALETTLRGRPPDPALVRPAHLSGLTPIDDIRATAAYRRAAALELVRRAVARLAAPAVAIEAAAA
jgi:CO/xanthine dehydrogenase FAD-binding subunit